MKYTDRWTDTDRRADEHKQKLQIARQTDRKIDTHTYACTEIYLYKQIRIKTLRPTDRKTDKKLHELTLTTVDTMNTNKEQMLRQTNRITNY